jgi:NAD(P)-dependent dehydrogenase (short-subunit alcohol dehydrogenase family)
MESRSQKEISMLLRNKTVIIYGAGEAIGSAVARAFGAEGARVFLSGRRLGPIQTVAREIAAAGGSAEAAQVDALDEEGIERYTDRVAEQAGGIDVRWLEDMTLLKRLSTLAEVANTAMFLASDHAGAITGAVANLTGGMSVD